MAGSSKTTPGNPPSRLRFWLPRIAFAIFAPVLLLALTEGALRLFHVGYSTDLMEPCTIHGRPSSCYNLFFAAPFFPPGMIKTPQFFSIDPVKPHGTYRIFVLGESAAMGDPDFAYGFSRYLEVMLRRRFPTMKFEVVNTGMVAINSHVSLAIARELAKYRPDMYVVYAGSNEVVGPYGPGAVVTTSSMSLPVIRASIFVRSSRIGQFLMESGQPRGEWRGMEMFLDKQVRADSPRMQPAYENFASNLKGIVDAAHASGAHVLLSTISTNLRDSAPFGSLHRAGLDPDALQSWSALVQHGAELESAQSFAEALKLYSSAAEIDDQYAELHFRIARCYWSLGNFSAAKEHYTGARDLDTLRFRADSRINEIIRETAKESGPNAVLLDTDSLFAGESRNGVIGGELLYDHVHLTPIANYLFARSVFEEVVKTLPNAQDSATYAEPPSELECERLLAFTGHDRARVAAEMADRMQRPPFTKQLNHTEQLQSLMLRAAGSTETPQDTAAQYQWAIAQYPGDLALHYKFGFFLFDYDRNASAQQLVLARPNDDFPVFLPDGTRIQ
ncbi:MAG TPA: tetratricopeptide repeat protein [Candidatus Acidoferrum sp.]|nr:tetratricopeptide repeat protein [Candidatus Acidoferrum sp.]